MMGGPRIRWDVGTAHVSGRARGDGKVSETNMARAVIATLVFVVAAMGADVSARAEGDRALGEYLSSECVTCHRASSRAEGIPSIHGLPEPKFIEIIRQYRAKQRSNPIMQTVAGRLSDEEIAALAAFFASLQQEREAR